MPILKGYEWTDKAITRATTGYAGDYEIPSRESIQSDQEAFQQSEDSFKQWDWQNPDKVGPQGETLPQYAKGWQPNGTADFGEGLSGWWNKAKSNVEAAFNKGYTGGMDISIIEKEAAGVFRKNADPSKVEANLKAIEAEHAKGAGMGAAWAEGTKEMFNQTLWGVLDLLSVPAKVVEKSIGAIGQTVGQGLDVDNLGAQIADNYNASELAYASIFDATINNEMHRLLDQGMTAKQAAQTVQIARPDTMWAELGGQLLLDPLNFVTLIGKGGAQAKMIKKAAGEFHDVSNPVIAKIIAGGADLDNAKAVQYIDEAVKTQQGLKAVISHAEDIVDAKGALDTYSRSYKLTSLTTSGKIQHIGGVTSEVLMHIVNNSGDEAIEIIRAGVNSLSKDPQVAAEGLATMLKFSDAPALFSKAGNETFALLDNLFQKHGATWLDDIAALKADKTALTKSLLGKLDEAGQDLFPSVMDMLKAEDAVKAAGTVDRMGEVKTVSEKTAALAERAKLIPDYVKRATRAHEAAQTVVSPINKFFVSAYMGWSPGYAFRNLSNNSLQLLVDYGPGALLGKADDILGKADRLYGGNLKGVFSEGGQAAGYVEKVSGRGTGVKAIVENVKKSGLKAPVLGASQTWEANAAARVIGKTFTKTFEGGVKAMTKAMTPNLKAAGFSDDLIKKLPTYIMQNDGDVTKIIAALQTEIKSGTIDLFNDISRIDPKYKNFLSDAGKWEEYSENVLKATSQEEAATAAKKIFDDLAQASDAHYGKLHTGDPTDDIDKFLELTVKDGGMPETRAELISLRKTKSRAAVQAAEDILVQANNLGIPGAGDLQKKWEILGGIGVWGKDAAKDADRLSDLANNLYRVQARGKGADLKALWNANKEFFKGAPPANLDFDTFAKNLWENYDGLVSKTWGGARDDSITKVTGYLDDLEKLGAPIDPAWKETLKIAQEGAQQYDSAVIGYKGEKWIEKTVIAAGTRPTKIAEIANKYGIATATEAGVAQDKKILNIINKYADTNFKSLNDPISLDLVESAFKKKGAVKAPSVVGEAVSLTDAKSMPRSELPPAASQRFADEAKRLRSELSGGETGNRAAGTATSNVSWYRELYKKGLQKPAIDKALNKIIMDQGADVGVNVERMKDIILDNFKLGDAASGTPPDLNILKLLGADEKTMAEALDNFNDITKGSYSLDEAIRMSGGTETVEITDALDFTEDVAHYDDAGNFVEPKRPAERILPDPTDGQIPTASEMVFNQREEVDKMRKWMVDDIAKNFGKKQLVDKAAEKGLKVAERELTQKLAENRLISSRVAQANRDFTLLNYGEKTYMDTAMAYIYPYQFWYKGTYGNWLKRVAQNPSVLANYSRYKSQLATVHAGMPEWWKYNLNTNDLPGVDVENPLYLNLEATLWPLNGITGLDYKDSSKNVNAWTKTLSFMNTFGPSTWTPLSMVTGLALHMKGETEAGDKWMGRLFPQSATIKAAASLLGVSNLETDPLILAFQQGGLDPNERRRAQRALANMMQDVESGASPYTKEQIQDAAYTQKGEIWDQAVRAAVNGRAPAQLSSFLFGVGFKGRTQQDMEIDKFYGDYGKLWTMRPNLSPKEFSEGMEALKTKYPFMDTVMLSGRDGVQRDAGLAYNVLTRIPPGQSTDIAKAAGIDPILLNKFFDDKGQIDQWDPADRMALMQGVLKMSAVLEIPPDMTRKEWLSAKNTYKDAMNEGTKQFGSDIWDKVDAYYQAKTVSYTNADSYLQKHPEVQQALDWKAKRVMDSPLLSAYYGGASVIEGYYRSQMYADIEKQMGAEVFDLVNQYNDIKTYGTPAEIKKYYNQNKATIKQYYAMRDQWQVTIDQNVAQMTAAIPEGESAGIRDDIPANAVGANNLAQAAQPEQQMTLQDFQAAIPAHTLALVQDYILQGVQLPGSANTQLSRLAKDLGFYDANELVQAIGTALYTAQQP